MTSKYRTVANVLALSPLIGAATLAGCGDVAEESGPAEIETESLSEALVYPNSAVTGFETLNGWTVSGATVARVTTRTQGNYAYAVTRNGVSVPTLRSVRFQGVGGPKSISLDLMLGAATDIGSLRVFLSSPSRGLNDVLLGVKYYAGLTPDEWHYVEFDVPAAIQAALQGSYNDLSVRISTPVPGYSDKVYLDNLRFDASCNTECRAHLEMLNLGLKVPTFSVTNLSASCSSVTLSAGQGIDAADLRGVALDPNPPTLQGPAISSPSSMVDGLGAAAPYVADEIAPFRMRYYRNEFGYGGWHTWNMSEYASQHGYGIVGTYNSTTDGWQHLPEGTEFSRVAGFNWNSAMPAAGIPAGRFDQLTASAASQIAGVGALGAANTGYDTAMLNLEHGVLSPDLLRAQSWYPSSEPEATRQAFEDAYYAGAERTYTSQVAAGRVAGFDDIGIYGWSPIGRTWWDIPNSAWPANAEWVWSRYGRNVYQNVDVLFPSVYAFYISEQNPAYVLANLDANRALFSAESVQKPMRPYNWNLYHGGGGGWRYWQGLPLNNEEQRAIIALQFFTGIEGVVSWGWSGTNNDHAVTVGVDSDAMVGSSFSLAPSTPAGGPARTFSRYSVIHVTSISNGVVTFQPIQPALTNYGITSDQPYYQLPQVTLQGRLRPRSEPVSAMVEGLALVRAFEYLLSKGTPVVDIPARDQFSQVLPIVRRVRLGKFSVIASYDPKVVLGGQARSVTLPPLDGSNCAITVPADDQVRFWVVRAP